MTVNLRTDLRPDGQLELASGVDALYLSGRAALPANLLEQLHALRLIAAEQEGPVEMLFGGLVMQLQPRKWGMYRFCFDHPYARFGVSPKAKIPCIRVQPRAEFLHPAESSTRSSGYATSWRQSAVRSSWRSAASTCSPTSRDGA